MNDTIRKLRADLEARHAEADAIVRKENPTGEELILAEKHFEECDRLTKQLEEANADADRHAKLKGRSESLAKFRSEPVPMAGTSRKSASDRESSFALAEWAPGGRLLYDADAKSILEETGPGVFGQKTWDVIRSVEYKRDFYGQYFRKGVRAIDLCTKTLQEGLDNQGGVFAPADLIMRVIGRSPAPTQLRNYVTTIPTGRDIVTMPRKQYNADDKYTTAFRVSWTGEAPASDVADVDDTNLLGEVEIPVNTAMMVGSFSKNLTEDSAFPIQSWLSGELEQVSELTYEDMILNGTGVGQPYGIHSNRGAADRPEVVLSGASAALAYDGLVNLWTALAPQYDENAIFAMNKKSAFRAVCKFKDGAQRPIFNRGEQDSGLASPRTKSIEGYPIVFTQFSDDVGSAGYPITFGDFRGYYLAQRISFSIQVLLETKAKRNQLEMVARMRFGGKPVEHWRLKIQKSNNS